MYVKKLASDDALNVGLNRTSPILAGSLDESVSSSGKIGAKTSGGQDPGRLCMDLTVIINVGSDFVDGIDLAQITDSSSCTSIFWTCWCNIVGSRGISGELETLRDSSSVATSARRRASATFKNVYGFDSIVSNSKNTVQSL